LHLGPAADSPVSGQARIIDEGIRLNITKKEVEDLPTSR